MLGEDTAYEQQIGAYRDARKQREKRRAVRIFIFHLAAYVLGNAFLGAWNALTYFVKGVDTLWFFLPLLFWGVGVIIHYIISVALFDEWWELDERTVASRMEG